MSWNGQPFGGNAFRILSGLKRDPWRGKISGVCAGISSYYGIRLWMVRALAILALLINPFLAVAAYAVATFFMPRLSPDEFGGASERNAGNSAKARVAESELPPELQFAALKDKFREIESRAGGIETLVTSPEFRLRRDFHKMGQA